MSRTPDDLVHDYLEQLDAELGDLPQRERRDVRDEIAAHIAEMRAELPAESVLEVRTLLDRLGDPAEIAAEARERFGVAPPKRRRVEVAALVLLSVGMVVPVLGWLAGVILLWISEVWNTREKVLGTVFAPAGWLLLGWLALETLGGHSGACFGTTDEQGRTISQNCSGNATSFSDVFWPTLLIAGVVASVATMIYLAVRLRRLNRSTVLA